MYTPWTIANACAHAQAQACTHACMRACMYIRMHAHLHAYMATGGAATTPGALVHGDAAGPLLSEIKNKKQDSVSSEIAPLLEFSCIKPIHTLHTALEHGGALGLLEDKYARAGHNPMADNGWPIAMVMQPGVWHRLKHGHASWCMAYGMGYSMGVAVSSDWVLWPYCHGSIAGP